MPINGVIAVIGEKGEDWKAALAADGEGAAPAASPEPKAEPAAAIPASPAPTPMPVSTAAAPVAAPASDGSRVIASPLAKSMAKEKGIDIAAVAGSGENGRVIKRDIENYQPAASNNSSATPASQSFAFEGGMGSEDVKMSMMRKAIAKNVTANKFSAPHFYLTIEMNMEQTIAARKRINEIAPSKISFNDIVLKAAAVALRQHPEINASWIDSNTIRIHKDISIGVAVATPEGLLLPTIKHIDMKSLSQINAEVREKAGLAKEKKLPPEEMQGLSLIHI